MRFFYKNNALNHIIWINIFVFLIMRLLIQKKYITPEAESFYFLASSTKIDIILQNPWTLLTQIFTHINPDHILSNMIVLYFFGNIFLKYFNNRQFLYTYMLGGLCSFICLIIFDDFIEWNYGASGATYAIMFATTAFVPNYSLKVYKNLFIQIKYITIFLIILSIILYPQNIQAHITHIGGGCYGLLYIYLLKVKKGSMIKKIFSFLSIFSNKNEKKIKSENDYEYNERKQYEERKLNQVLDKISKSGYSSLSKKEKEILERNN